MKGREKRRVPKRAKRVERGSNEHITREKKKKSGRKGEEEEKQRGLYIGKAKMKIATILFFILLKRK